MPYPIRPPLYVTYHHLIDMILTRLRRVGQFDSADTGDSMRIVGDTGPATERELHAGRLRCPYCDGVLRPWGSARTRTIQFGVGVCRAVRPRRTRCTGCGATHVLLPDWMLLRRAYAAPVIWSALAAHARGVGYRRIALRLRIPATTIRDWLRAFRLVEPALIAQLGYGGTSAVAALERMNSTGLPWRTAVRLTAGRLLRNTTPPHAAEEPPSARSP
jgi:hypothetical protein